MWKPIHPPAEITELCRSPVKTHQKEMIIIHFTWWSHQNNPQFLIIFHLIISTFDWQYLCYKVIKISTFFGSGHYRTIAKLRKFHCTFMRQGFSTDRQMVKQPKIQEQGTTSDERHCINDYFLQLPRILFKKLFLGTKLGEELWAMSFAKSVPTGHKLIECKCSVGGKNSSLRYIPRWISWRIPLRKARRSCTSS